MLQRDTQQDGKHISKRRILIVDDLEDYLKSLRRALFMKWEVLCAKSLDEAISLLKEQDVDIALLDVRLSESDISNRDGITVLKWIRENRPTVKTVMMSGYRDTDAVDTAKDLGAVEFLRKPIDVLQLNDLLHSLYFL